MTVDTSLQERADMDISTDVFSKEMLAELNKHEKAIRTALSGVDKNMEKIAFNLYWIYSNKAYKAMGCESITDYALDTFDLSKSSTYSFISLVERFAARSESGSITDKFDDRYKGYSSSKLSLLVNLSDAQIEELDIDSSMSVRDIKKRLKKADNDNAVDISDKKGLLEKQEDVEDTENAQGTMKIEGNEISIPVPEADADDGVCDDDSILEYVTDTVYEFSVQDDERTVMKEIKSILKKNKAEKEESFFRLILRYPVRKG